jgi:hypothetical protein
MEVVSTIPVPLDDDTSFHTPNVEQNDAAPLPSLPPNPESEPLDPLDPQNIDLEASPDASKTSTRLVKFQLFETKAVFSSLVLTLTIALLHHRLKPE